MNMKYTQTYGSVILFFICLIVWFCYFPQQNLKSALGVTTNGISYTHSIRIDIFILENFFLGKKQKCLFLNLYDIKEENH